MIETVHGGGLWVLVEGLLIGSEAVGRSRSSGRAGLVEDIAAISGGHRQWDERGVDNVQRPTDPRSPTYERTAAHMLLANGATDSRNKHHT